MCNQRTESFELINLRKDSDSKYLEKESILFGG
jgi:hypothetical protein